MKSKIKLTDLRHVETSKEEMNLLKGGEDTEKGIPWCAAGCDCTCACTIEIGDKQQNSSLVTSSNTNSSALNIAVGILTLGISRLFS